MKKTIPIFLMIIACLASYYLIFLYANQISADLIKHVITSEIKIQNQKAVTQYGNLLKNKQINLIKIYESTCQKNKYSNFDCLVKIQIQNDQHSYDKSVHLSIAKNKGAYTLTHPIKGLN